MEKHVIWNSNPDYADWKADLESEYPEMSEEERIEEMHRLNNGYLDDERINLNIVLENPIIAIADLGLWDGRHTGYKEILSGNIKDCLTDDCDATEWYVDEKDFRCTASHHDGTNYYLYRMWKDDVTKDQKTEFLNNIYEQLLTDVMVEKMTVPIGHYIQEVYGW